MQTLRIIVSGISTVILLCALIFVVDYSDLSIANNITAYLLILSTTINIIAMVESHRYEQKRSKL